MASGARAARPRTCAARTRLPVVQKCRAGLAPWRTAPSCAAVPGRHAPPRPAPPAAQSGRAPEAAGGAAGVFRGWRRGSGGGTAGTARVGPGRWPRPPAAPGWRVPASPRPPAARAALGARAWVGPGYAGRCPRHCRPFGLSARSTAAAGGHREDGSPAGDPSMYSASCSAGGSREGPRAAGRSRWTRSWPAGAPGAASRLWCRAADRRRPGRRRRGEAACRPAGRPVDTGAAGLPPWKEADSGLEGAHACLMIWLTLSTSLAMVEIRHRSLAVRAGRPAPRPCALPALPCAPPCSCPCCPGVPLPSASWYCSTSRGGGRYGMRVTPCVPSSGPWDSGPGRAPPARAPLELGSDIFFRLRRRRRLLLLVSLPARRRRQ